MQDIKFIRENLELFKNTAEHKNIDLDFDQLLKVEEERKGLRKQVEDLKAEKNAVSKKISQMDEVTKKEAFAEMKKVGEQEKKLEKKLIPLDKEFKKLMFQVPMPVDERTPVGKDDNDNVEIKAWGEKPKFDFQFKSHEELGETLDIIDIPRAVKIAGTRSYALKGDGARLESALMKYAQDFIARKGYKLLSLPVMVDEDALWGTGHLPAESDDVYHLEKDDKYLVGTSEVAIASMHRNEILREEDLPIRYASLSLCFRRESGSYGKDTHGLYRVHQFVKVEQFVICRDDKEVSRQFHEEMLGNSEEFLQSLNLPYRVLNICTGDMGQGKHYMNDIETWMPSRDNYGETHSCSTLLDFQARRLNLRYKDKEGQTHFCHTLNNTVAAGPRLLIPIMEINQTKDGKIEIPTVLRPYMDNQNIIENI